MVCHSSKNQISGRQWIHKTKRYNKQSWGPQLATNTLPAKGTTEKDDKGDTLKQRNRNWEKTEIITEKRRKIATTSGHCEQSHKKLRESSKISSKIETGAPRRRNSQINVLLIRWKLPSQLHKPKRQLFWKSLVSNPWPRKQLEKRRVVTTPEEQSEVVTIKGLAFGISSRLEKVKASRSVKREQHLLHYKSLAFRENI